MKYVKMFLTMGNKSLIEHKLELLGLSQEEVKVYLSLLKGPRNQLAISRDTGIARSNVYRIIDELIQKGIVHEVTNKDDKLLETTSPKALELLIVQKENEAKDQRDIFKELLPHLTAFANQEVKETESFSIKSYVGISGIKQMLWNELSTKGEICMFSCGNLNAATGKHFAEQFRKEMMIRGIYQRALENPESDNITESEHPGYDKHYQLRFIKRAQLNIMPEITIHDDTVSIYNNWANDIQLGTEVKNPFLVTFFRQVFEHYWKLGRPAK